VFLEREITEGDKRLQLCSLLEEAKNKEANGVPSTSIKNREKYDHHQNQGGAKNHLRN
jgi:hypothetical protein